MQILLQFTWPMIWRYVVGGLNRKLYGITEARDDNLQSRSLVLWLWFNPCTYRIQVRSFCVNPPCSVMVLLFFFFAFGRCECQTFVYSSWLLNEHEKFRDILHQCWKQMTVFFLWNAFNFVCISNPWGRSPSGTSMLTVLQYTVTSKLNIFRPKWLSSGFLCNIKSSNVGSHYIYMYMSYFIPLQCNHQVHRDFLITLYKAYWWSFRAETWKLILNKI